MQTDKKLKNKKILFICPNFVILAVLIYRQLIKQNNKKNKKQKNKNKKQYFGGKNNGKKRGK